MFFWQLNKFYEKSESIYIGECNTLMRHDSLYRKHKHRRQLLLVTVPLKIEKMRYLNGHNLHITAVVKQ